MDTMRRRSDSEGLRSLINRLTCYKVLVWGQSSTDTYPDVTTDREATSVEDAHVVSSLIKTDDMFAPQRHKVVVDIDHPSFLVKSTTPGHYHLYIDVPGGIEWDKYQRLLEALALAGVIEEGYANASISRGHSDVRLPWIKKGQET